MLEITMRDGNSHRWGNDRYTDYDYQGKVFVVIKDSQWIGIYNMDEVASVEYYPDPADEETAK